MIKTNDSMVEPLFYLEKDRYRDVNPIFDQDENDLPQYHKIYEGERIKILCEGAQLMTPGGHPVETRSERLAFFLLRELNHFGEEYHLPLFIVNYYYSWLDHFGQIPREYFRERIMEKFKSDWTLDCPFEDNNKAILWRDMFAYRELREIEFLPWLEKLPIQQLGGILILAEQYGSVNLAYILSHKSRPRYAYDFVDYFIDAFRGFILPSTEQESKQWRVDYVRLILQTYKKWSRCIF